MAHAHVRTKAVEAVEAVVEAEEAEEAVEAVVEAEEAEEVVGAAVVAHPCPPA